MKGLTPYLIALAVLLADASPTRAADAMIANSDIAGHVAENARGVVAVNQAAGDSNLQANAAALGGQSANVSISQRLQVPGVDKLKAAARIGASAFSNVRGALSVNQASGIANAQSNSVSIATGINGEVGDAALSATLPDAAGPVRSGQAGGTRIVEVDSTAFRNASGIVQLNQTAGTGNSSSNNFVLHLGVQPNL